MKVTAEKDTAVFEPIKLTIILESQAELEVVYQAGNYSSAMVAALLKQHKPIPERLAESFFHQIYDALQEYVE